MCLITGLASAQNANTANLLPPSLIPKSPTVTSLQRFDGQRNVDLKTGAAQVSIPLATISSGSLQLPVSLSYSYTGLQVYRPFDLLGLGWSLQAGSAITYQINGLRDDLVHGDATYNAAVVDANMTSQTFLKKAADGYADTGPDLYTFSLPDGTAGRFIIQDTSIVLVPKQPLQIRRLSTTGYQITTEAGVRYQFEAQETTIPNHNNFGAIGEYVSAWQLTRIISTNNADTLQLHYSAHARNAPSHCPLTTGRFFIGSLPSPCNTTSSFHNVFLFPTQITSQYLDSVTTRGAHLIIARDRNNASLVVQGVQLIATTAGRREIKRMSFAQSFFNGGTLGDRSLRLDQVQESANGVVLPAYRFQYNQAFDLPARRSAAQDHWGYYNGADVQNGTGENDGLPALLADPRLSSPANRNPDYQYAELGALQKVVYPTGGTTAFTYEPGQYGLESRYLKASSYTDVNVSCLYDPLNVNATTGLTTSTAPFTVTEESDVAVVFTRQPYHGDPNNPNTNSGLSNHVQDFDIWQVLADGTEIRLTDTRITGTTYKIYDNKTSEEFPFHFPPGNYRASVYCEVYESGSALDFRLPTSVWVQDAPGPGVRVKKTATVAKGMPSLIRTYAYLVADSVGNYSSGLTLLPIDGKGNPVYTANAYTIEGGIANQYNNLVCPYEDVSSDNTGRGNDFNKYSFYYQRVTEQLGDEQGTTVSLFEHRGDQFNEVVLTEQQIFRQRSYPVQGLQLAQRDRYIRSPLGTSMVFPMFSPRVTYERPYLDQKEYIADQSQIQAIFEAQVRTENFRYDEHGAVSLSVTHATYHQQRLVRSMTRANGHWTIQKYKYLTDYDPANPQAAALRVYNFNPIIETQTWQRSLDGQDSILVAGHLMLYDPMWRSPQSSWSLRLTRPASAANSEGRSNGLYTDFQSDSRYQLDESVSYHPTTGLLQQRQVPHGAITTYVWGYDRSQVVAQVDNATFAQIQAIVGANQLATLLGPRPGDDAQVRQALAPLRAQLPQAHVTLFTYRPLVGLTSQTDPAGRTSYYEYDVLGRLLRVRDEQQRILTQQQYKYARP